MTKRKMIAKKEQMLSLLATAKILLTLFFELEDEVIWNYQTPCSTKHSL